MNELSDRGSTPLASTRTVLDEHLLFLRRLCRKGDDLIHKTETPSCESKAVFFAILETRMNICSENG